MEHYIPGIYLLIRKDLLKVYVLRLGWYYLYEGRKDEAENEY